MHVLALAAAIVSLTMIPMMLVCVGVLISATVVLRGAWNAGGVGVMALGLREDGDASWRDRAGEWHSARSLSASFVSPWLTILRLHPQEAVVLGACWLVLGPDSGEPEDLRQLRVWLNHGRVPGGTKNPDED